MAGACRSVDAESPSGPRAVTYDTRDAARICADEYGAGTRGLVLVHGGRFDKESWAPQARAFAAAGHRVLAIDLRGHGQSKGGRASDEDWGGYALDVLGAVDFLRASGAATVSLVGGSMGGWAVAEASALAPAGAVDAIVLISASSIERPEAMRGKKLFITTRDDPWADGRPRLPDVEALFARTPEPKRLVVLDGSAHAQHIFASEQGDALLREILAFLDGT